MPTPGSHSYDVQRTRLRGRLEAEGVNDKNADKTGNRIMQRDNEGTPPGAHSDRAAGPYGERTGGGDAGNVIGLRSPAFSDSTLMPDRCSRDGGDRSPALGVSPGAEIGTVRAALDDRRLATGTVIGLFAR